MRKKITMICCIALSVVFFAAIVWLLAENKSSRTEAESVADEINNGAERNQKLFDAGKISLKEEVTISTEVIAEDLRNIGKLVTGEYGFTMVENYEKTVPAGLFNSTATIIYSYDGVVNAGIDCEKINVEKDDENKKIMIEIPKAELGDVVIDQESFQIFEEKQGLWSKIRLDDVNKSLIEFKEAAKKKALEKGLLEKADENAENLISRFVSSLVDTGDYSVTFIHRQEENR